MTHIEQTSSGQHDVLTPLTEYAGKVVEITENKITLEIIERISFTISPDTIDKWKDMIRIGKHVGILALEDGSIRVRNVC
jgi:hypothetical protein